jgi:hypothetical protein
VIEGMKAVGRRGIFGYFEGYGPNMQYGPSIELRNGSNSEGADLIPLKRRQHLPMANGLHERD